jgi:hypothetical protein
MVAITSFEIIEFEIMRIHIDASLKNTTETSAQSQRFSANMDQRW